MCRDGVRNGFRRYARRGLASLAAHVRMTHRRGIEVPPERVMSDCKADSSCPSESNGPGWTGPEAMDAPWRHTMGSENPVYPDAMQNVVWSPGDFTSVFWSDTWTANGRRSVTVTAPNWLTPGRATSLRLTQTS
jgi:hypothetical protein